jgi:hypothetical protein
MLSDELFTLACVVAEEMRRMHFDPQEHPTLLKAWMLRALAAPANAVVDRFLELDRAVNDAANIPLRAITKVQE